MACFDPCLLLSPPPHLLHDLCLTLFAVCQFQKSKNDECGSTIPNVRWRPSHFISCLRCIAEGGLAAPPTSNLAIAPTEAYQHGRKSGIVPIVTTQIGSSAEGSPDLGCSLGNSFSARPIETHVASQILGRGCHGLPPTNSCSDNSIADHHTLLLSQLRTYQGCMDSGSRPPLTRIGENPLPGKRDKRLNQFHERRPHAR
ncbi:hypothetical protein L207DRAFT_538484 [Hyaloscypha variabilis F]|jgi:hypothetical protein|uniref:Uncharacterized protein n=1 Tax=Hyaloscypha variabilis (strain UAMH 11265 / GT02V1 / F) TaxID=1149755 RepID=A0A2J6QU27_HYAVF|nr:hypothetical protein L207DRAFT_538484 [Hyaloscypha variabilis F]